MSDDLIAFLKAWHDWATDGVATSKRPFSKEHGLCINAYRFAGYDEQGVALANELNGLLAGNGTPFGYQDYWQRSLEYTQHECPKRLAWVRQKLVEAGELVA